MDIEELNNNSWLINGIKIYAPNLKTAIARYKQLTQEAVERSPKK